MFLFFDTETTGVPKDYKAPVTEVDNWPRVTQFAFAVYNAEGDLLTSAQSLVKPDGWEVPKEQFFIDHNMSTERCQEHGVPMQHLLSPFVAVINDCEYMIAHNISFDYKVLGAEMIRYNFTSEKKLTKICTMIKSTSFCRLPSSRGGFKWPKLEELHEVLFGHKPEGAHDAMNDVMTTAKCFFELLKREVIKLEPANNETF